MLGGIKGFFSPARFLFHNGRYSAVLWPLEGKSRWKDGKEKILSFINIHTHTCAHSSTNLTKVFVRLVLKTHSFSAAGPLFSSFRYVGTPCTIKVVISHWLFCIVFLSNLCCSSLYFFCFSYALCCCEMLMKLDDTDE